ncbi:hypothetical protein BDA96_06G020600 [Sorghum bicolor]|nr:hypothetical protein BDA96_06G020600 [Sorghum bicolor]
MDSGAYFADLITKGHGLAGQSENPPPPQEVVAQDEVQTIGKRNQRRTKNFTVEEDEQLVKAWLNVSLDRVKGVDQPHTTYWERIHAYFHVHKDFSSDRTQGSLMNRWSGIQHDVNLFAGCLSKTECENQSGVSIDDKQADALKMFIREDRQHRQFSYMHCWKILKDQTKWADRRRKMETQKTISKKHKVVANSSTASASPLLPSPTIDGNEHSNSALQRPPGQKKKQKLWQHCSIEALDYLLAKKKEADADKELNKEERCKKAFALQEERIRLEKEKLELQRDQFEFNKKLEEERIMNVDTSHMCPDQHQYYQALKNDILARCLNN